MSDRPIEKDTVEEEILGDKTAYGEFVSTFHHWTGLEGNHKRGSYLENLTTAHGRHQEKAADIPMKEE